MEGLLHARCLRALFTAAAAMVSLAVSPSVSLAVEEHETAVFTNQQEAVSSIFAPAVGHAARVGVSAPVRSMKPLARQKNRPNRYLLPEHPLHGLRKGTRASSAGTFDPIVQSFALA